MRPHARSLLLLAGLALSAAASAQTLSFNLDVGAGPVPSDTFGAAANQPGTWMPIAAATPFVPIPLTNVHGAATGATLTYDSGFDFYSNNPQTSGDDEALLDDTQGVFATTHWTIANLRPGEYDVWSYAWAPDSPIFFKTRVAVAGSADPAQVVGGQGFAGAYVQGAHYARHRATVAAGGTLQITFSEAVSACTVNGVQIRELLPPPENYCAAGTSTHGCQASMTSAGVPSATATSGFVLNAVNVDGQRSGLIFYGTGGRAAIPWGSGSSTLCIRAPTQRTPVQGSGGTSGTCSGALTLDWNDFLAHHPGALGNPRSIGQVFQAQAWYRDPSAAQFSSLSDAIEFTLGP